MNNNKFFQRYNDKHTGTNIPTPQKSNKIMFLPIELIVLSKYTNESIVDFGHRSL